MTAAFSPAPVAAVVVHGSQLVVGNELLEGERFSGIFLDAPYDGFPADGAEIRNVIVHAAGLLGAVDTSGMHVASLKHVHYSTVLIMVDQVCPGHFMHLGRKREVGVPAQRLCISDFIADVPANRTLGDECIVIEVFISEFTEPVSACLMLYDSP